MNPQAAINMVQEITIIHEHYEDRPHIFVAILAALSMLFSVVCLSCVALGSLTLLIGCLGLEDKPILPPERPKLKVMGYRKVYSARA